MDATLLSVQLLGGGFVVLAGVTALALLEAGRRPRPLSSRRALAADPRPEPAEPGRPSLDAAIERAALRGLGEARILRALGGVVRVRLYECPSCPAAADAAGGRPGCPLERLQLEECFFGVQGGPARARETECRRAGARYCEFEVHTLRGVVV